eukprot:TRINITY_DN16239_c0_g2_i1.p1 TRINITY_DN16239_c0_g2~~TRINITY_DN16239_c0_g2_i1.p1  ORF type:complete len:759 (+),score=-18.24 TRINITY_DN16239_c0_g2_i1:31-2277(+)
MEPPYAAESHQRTAANEDMPRPCTTPTSRRQSPAITPQKSTSPRVPATTADRHSPSCMPHLTLPRRSPSPVGIRPCDLQMRRTPTLSSRIAAACICPKVDDVSWEDDQSCITSGGGGKLDESNLPADRHGKHDTQAAAAGAAAAASNTIIRTGSGGAAKGVMAGANRYSNVVLSPSSSSSSSCGESPAMAPVSSESRPAHANRSSGRAMGSTKAPTKGTKGSTVVLHGSRSRARSSKVHAEPAAPNATTAAMALRLLESRYEEKVRLLRARDRECERLRSDLRDSEQRSEFLESETLWLKEHLDRAQSESEQARQQALVSEREIRSLKRTLMVLARDRGDLSRQPQHQQQQQQHLAIESQDSEQQQRLPSAPTHTQLQRELTFRSRTLVRSASLTNLSPLSPCATGATGANEPSDVDWRTVATTLLSAVREREWQRDEERAREAERVAQRERERHEEAERERLRQIEREEERAKALLRMEERVMEAERLGAQARECDALKGEVARLMACLMAARMEVEELRSRPLALARARAGGIEEDGLVEGMAVGVAVGPGATDMRLVHELQVTKLRLAKVESERLQLAAAVEQMVLEMAEAVKEQEGFRVAAQQSSLDHMLLSHALSSVRALQTSVHVLQEQLLKETEEKDFLAGELAFAKSKNRQRDLSSRNEGTDTASRQQVAYEIAHTSEQEAREGILPHHSQGQHERNDQYSWSQQEMPQTQLQHRSAQSPGQSRWSLIPSSARQWLRFRA